MCPWVLLSPAPCCPQLAYGTATAVQHHAAHRESGRADARGVLRLARDPRWMASVGGDTVGLVLQVVALASGPVLVVQPLLVLAVPVDCRWGACWWPWASLA